MYEERIENFSFQILIKQYNRIIVINNNKTHKINDNV